MTSGRGSGWRALAVPLTLGRTAGQGAELVGWLLLAHRLAPRDLGVLTIGYLLVRYLGIVTDWGGSLAGARDVSIDSSEIPALIAHRRRLGRFAAVLFALGALVLGEPHLLPLAVAAAVTGYQMDWVALGQRRPLAAALPSLIRGGAFVALAAAAATLLEGAVAVALAAVAGAWASMAGAPRGRNRHAGRRAWPPVWPLIAVAGAQVYISLDTVLIGALRGPEQAGIYGVVYRVPLAWVTLVGLAVSALIPVASAQIEPDDRRRLRLQAHRAGWAGAALVTSSIPVAWVAFGLLFPASMDSGRTPMVILLLATALSTASSPRSALLVAQHRDRTYALVILFAAALNVVVNVVAIPRWGMNGAAASTVLTEFAVLLAILRIEHLEDPDARP